MFPLADRHKHIWADLFYPDNDDVVIDKLC